MALGLAAGYQVGVGRFRGRGKVYAFGNDSAFVVRFAFGIRVGELRRSDGNGTGSAQWSALSRAFCTLGSVFCTLFRLDSLCLDFLCLDFLRLDQNRLDWLGWRALGRNEPAVAVELDGGRLDDVRVLPEARVSRVKGRPGRVVGRHAMRGDVNRGRRRQQRPVRLFC